MRLAQRIRASWLDEIEGRDSTCPHQPEAWLADLEHLSKMQEALRKMIAQIRMGNYRLAENLGHDFMQLQQEMNRLRVIALWEREGLRHVYRADVRYWTYAVLAKQLAPHDVISRLNGLIQFLEEQTQ